MSEKRCRLFLVSPPGPASENIPSCLEQAAKVADIASLLIRPGADRGKTEELIAAVLAIGYEHNIAILLEGDAETAAQTGVDGVQVASDIEQYAHARSILGSDRIVGVLSDGSRHSAMQVGEAGADYVAFDQNQLLSMGSGETREDLDPISWWSHLFEIPSVAFAPVAPDAIEHWVSAGCDFIRPDDAMWSSAERATDTVRQFNARIDELS